MNAELNITTTSVVYPDSDGKPMAENTKQAEWIVTIMGNLDLQFRDDPNVFVAMDNFIYAVEGEPTMSLAPDVYVAFGRPKGHRGSYKVWEEDDIFPQVVFEIFSPSNSAQEMIEKRDFCFSCGAEEFYVYNPENNTLEGDILTKRGVTPIQDWTPFVSPRLGIRFEQVGSDLHIYGANGQRFLTFIEIGKRAELEANRAEREAKRAETEARRATRESNRATRESNRANDAVEQLARMRANMLAAGLDPDAYGT